MFDVYLQSKQPNRKSQRLLALASVLSTVATAVFLVVLWLQGKMGINMVDPPTIEFVLVQLTDVDAAPPPPPPPPPAGDTSEEEEEEVPEDDLVEEELTQPKETPDKLPEKKKGPKGRKVPGVVGGVPGGVPGGVIAASWAAPWVAPVAPSRPRGEDRPLPSGPSRRCPRRPSSCPNSTHADSRRPTRGSTTVAPGRT